MPESELGAPRWKDWFWRLYNLTPPVTDKVRRFCAPAVALARNIHVPVLLFRGYSLVGTESAVLTAGDVRWSYIAARRFFRDEPHREKLESVPVYRLNKVLNEWAPRVELMFARIDAITARVLNSDYITLPGSISLVTTVPANIAELNRLNGNVKEDVRRIRANSLGYKISTTLEDYDEFYDHYHLPLMRARHGPNAVVRNRYLLRRFVEGGAILWITRDGHRIAGCAIQQEQTQMNLVASGIKDGRMDILRQGALAAIYYFGSCYALEKGCKHIELGSTAPYLSDGLLQYKRKWHPKVGLADCAYSVLMHWPQLTDAVAEFLASSSPIIVEGNKLSAITAIRSREPATCEQAERLFKQLAIAGLSRFWVVSPSGWQCTENGKVIGETELKMVQTLHHHDIKGRR